MTDFGKIELDNEEELIVVGGQKVPKASSARAKKVISPEQHRLSSIQKNFKFKTLRHRKNVDKLIAMILRGINKASQNNVLESLKINDDWIINIEGNLKYIDNIVRNPKSSLIDNRIIVNTSKAKRTDSETIRYLSSHTSDIESIEEDDIRPSRLNVKEIDTDLAIYENRFVYALMIRLRAFLEQRYIAIKDQINCFDTNQIRLDSKFEVPNGDVSFEMSVKVRDKKSDSVSVRENNALLERIEHCRKHISSLMGSDFARTLSKGKLLMPPINKTNVIRMHTDYKGCYNLWLFLSAYTATGYSISVEEQDLDVENDYYEDLSFIIAATVKNMADNHLFSKKVLGKGQPKKRIKNFRPVKSLTYIPRQRGSIAKKEDLELISQYYYDKLKRLLKSSEEIKAKKDEELHVAFRAYFKSISSLNNNLFDDALQLKKYRKPHKNVSGIDAKKEQISFYKEASKRVKLLRTLKENDYKATLREEQKYLIRIEKIQDEIKAIKEKERKAIQKQKERERQRIQKIRQAEKRARLAILNKQKREKEKERAQKLKQQQLERMERQFLLQKEKQRIAQQRAEEKAQRDKEKQEQLMQQAILRAEEKAIKEKERQQAQKEKERQQKREKTQRERQRQKEKAQKERQRQKEKAQKEKERQQAKEAAQKQGLSTKSKPTVQKPAPQIIEEEPKESDESVDKFDITNFFLE